MIMALDLLIENQAKPDKIPPQIMIEELFKAQWNGTVCKDIWASL